MMSPCISVEYTRNDRHYGNFSIFCGYKENTNKLWFFYEKAFWKFTKALSEVDWPIESSGPTICDISTIFVNRQGWYYCYHHSTTSGWFFSVCIRTSLATPVTTPWYGFFTWVFGFPSVVVSLVGCILVHSGF